MSDKTSMFNVVKLKEEMVKSVLKDVYFALKERGYDPINQITGYIISGDPGYISSFKNARLKMLEIDRSEIVKALLEGFLEKCDI